MKRKLISIVAIVAIVLSLCVMPSIAAQNCNESFNSFEAGQTETGSFTGGSVYAFPSAENKSLGATSSVINTFDTITSGGAIISYDFYLTGKNNQKRLFQIFDSAKTGTKRTAVIFANSDGTLNANGGNFVTYYPLNKWFNITLVADIDNHVFDVYVDRQLCCENVSFYSGSNANEIGIIETACGSELTYIDNAYVSGGFSSKATATTQAVSLAPTYIDRDVNCYPTGNDARIIKGMSITSTASNIAVAQFPSSSDKSLKFVGGNGVSWLWNSLNKPVTDGTLLISYDYYFNTPISARILEVYGTYNDGNTRSVYIGTDTLGRFTINEGARSDFTYSIGKRYNISVVCDVDNSKYYVYIDGKNVSTAGFGFFRGATSVSTLKTTYNTAPSAGGEMYIDNMYAESFSSLADANAVLEARRLIRSDNFTQSNYGKMYADKVEGCLSDYRAIGATDASRTASLALLKQTVSEYVSYPQTEIWSQNFDSFTPGNALSATDGFYSVSGDVTAAASKDGNAVKVTNAGSRSRFNKAFSNLTSTSYFVAFDFMQPTVTDVDMIARSTETTGNRVATQIYTAEGNIRFKYGDGNGSQTSSVLLAGYEANRWYHIEYFVDLATETFNVWIDSKSASYTTYPFMFTFAPDYTNIGRVFDSYTDTKGTYYLDNINIYENALRTELERISLPDIALDNFSLSTATSGADYVLNWSSTDDDTINAETGVFAAPTTGYKDVTLTLTTTYKNTYTADKIFSYKVKSQQLIDSELQTEYDALTLDTNVTGDKYFLPGPSNSELSIRWEITDTDIIAENGNVTHLAQAQSVIVYAYISYGRNKLRKQFTLTVSPLMPFMINSVIYEDEDLNEVTTPPLNGQILTVSLSSNGEMTSGTLYVAFYAENSELVGVKTYNAEESTTIDIYEYYPATAKKIKYYVWDKTTLKPLSTSAEALIPTAE